MGTEAAFVFDKHGSPLFWWQPEEATETFLPDSGEELYRFIREHRTTMAGTAHIHPWEGLVVPSWEDVTTWSTTERSHGHRYIWAIATFTDIKYFSWAGPDLYRYEENHTRRFRLRVEDIERLRDMGRKETVHGNH